MKEIAIVGGGIAGLGSAWFLHRDFELAVFEADNHAGGHTNTVTVAEEGRTVAIDTGFMVFNHVTYPNLTRLFRTLEVPTRGTEMSFSVRHDARNLEYCGSSLNRLFAQRRNLLRPSFYRMLSRIARFNREASEALDDPSIRAMTLSEYVASRGYGDDFLHLFLIPMSSAVWSTPPDQMLRFPAATLLRFFHNHGFLGLHSQHPWRTVQGGARTYVEKLVAPFRDRVFLRSPVRRVKRVAGRVEISTDGGTRRFDKVIMACHPPATLKILGDDATAEERKFLTPFRYQPNTATLHTDASVMPRSRLAWSSWNYRLGATLEKTAPPRTVLSTELHVSTHYWMNRLQGVSDRTDYFVSINGQERLDPAKTLRTIAYEHPLFDPRAVEAQPGIAGLNAAASGRTETYFAGAWQRYGFHEDGLLSAADLAKLLLGRDPWNGLG